MFNWGSPFQQTPQQELRFSVPCLTLDLWSVALPVIVHYRIADGRILAREPNAIALMTEMIAQPIASEASRLPLADVNRRRERLRDVAAGSSAGRDELNSGFVRRIRSDFGIRVIDLFVDSPDLGSGTRQAVTGAAAHKLVADHQRECRNAESETGSKRLETILALADWSPEQKRTLSEAVLRYEAMGRRDGKDSISIFNA